MHCVSTARNNPAENNTSAATAAVVTAVQIRWAASDLPFLATNPLQPSVAARALMPMETSATASMPASQQRPSHAVLATSQVRPVSTSVSAVTIHGIPSLSPRNQLLLGLSFVPLALAAAFAAGYLFLSLVSSRRQARRRDQPKNTISDRTFSQGGSRDSFQPSIISFPVLVLLAGFTITAVPLLQLGSLSLFETNSAAPLPVTAFTAVKKRDGNTEGAPSPILVTLTSQTAPWVNTSAVTRSS